MAFQTVFKRVEKKYLLSEEQYNELRKRLRTYMSVDQYGETTICNIYYDTPDHVLVRRSMEKPIYKEKLRVRSYGTPKPGGTVFVEVKKKFKGVVYKRRASMKLEQSDEFTAGNPVGTKDKQIENELLYFIKFYKGIAPAMYLSYDRIALFGNDDPELRVTFDRNITFREEDLRLESGSYGRKILPEGTRVMEIKITNAMPLWLAHILDELKIFPASFSKYGSAYALVTKERLAFRNKTEDERSDMKEKVNHCA
ncbi:MAG: polyphosphate polymerase domain-containing protein [Ruminococcus sp.]|nr:polyphosphate polymerase domain-containing protein [Ruminococcus sp.]